MKGTLKDIGLAALAKTHNKLVEKEDRVKKFRDRATASRKIRKALDAAKDQVVRLVEPDYNKRGDAVDRFKLYSDGMLASEYVTKCENAGHSTEDAKRDLRYDARRELIALV